MGGAPDLTIGTTIAHFEVESELGRGGMGVVYLARDVDLDRLVALKVLPNDRVGDRERRARFLREARSAAAVNHTNVATIYEVGETGDTIYIAMEHVAGESLANLLERERPPLARAIEIALRIARALAAAHDAAVMHRDLKPGNVMMSSAGVVKLLDFGLAKSTEPVNALDSTLDVVTSDRALLGTPAYMSPEQCRRQPVDGRSDIFSFGIVLYELLTGQRPFRAPSYPELAVAIMTEAPTPIAELSAEVPPELLHLVERCLAKSPGERVQSFAEITAVLEPLREGASSDSKTRPPAVSTTPTRKRRWLLPAIAAALALAAGLLFLGLRSPEPSHTQPPHDAGARVAQRELRESQLTSHNGRERVSGLAVAADGNLLAYQAKQLWLRDVAGKQVRSLALAGAPGGVVPLDFLPNHRQLLAKVDTAEGPAVHLVELRDGSHRVWRAGIRYARLAPAADRIAYAAEHGLFVAPVTGTGERLLATFAPGTRASELAWSPDGKWLAAVILQRGVNRIEVFAADGSGSSRIVPTGAYGAGVTWESASQLLYTLRKGPGSALCRATIAQDGRAKQPARCFHRWPEGHVDSLHFTRGRLIYCKQVQLMGVETVGLDAAGRVAGSLVALSGQQGKNTGEGWTRDGRVLFTSERGSQSEILAQAPGGVAQPLARDGFYPLLVGDELIVSRRNRSARGDTCALVRIGKGGEQPLWSAPAEPEVRCPRLRCAVSGQRCALLRFGTQYLFRRLDPTNGRELGPARQQPGQLNDFVTLSDDGTTLAWAIEAGGTAVALLDLDSGAYREIRPRGSLRPHDVSWLPSKQGWLVAGRDVEHGQCVARLHADGRYELLIGDTGGIYHNPHLSPDGKTLTLTVDRSRFDLFTLAAETEQ